jgi:hypothetical protein
MADQPTSEETKKPSTATEPPKVDKAPTETGATTTADIKNDRLIHIKVYSPFQMYFDAEGYSISAVNRKGPFDILKHHHKFMTLIDPCELVIQTPDGEQRIRISRGVMHVKSDQVTVFLDV